MTYRKKKKNFAGEIDTGTQLALEDQIANGFPAYLPEDEEHSALYGGAPLVSSHKPKAVVTPGYTKCYESHPALKLGGGTFIGGSCSYPVTHDADVYIGFEYSMKVIPYDPLVRSVAHISHVITDMQAPSNHKTFTDLVEFAAQQLALGKTVHAGCIGGHGRTGTFLSALVKRVNGTEDAITWVREHYCKKAVESEAQVEFLHKYFGITKVQGHKNHFQAAPKGGHSYTPHPALPKYGSKELPPAKKKGGMSFAGATVSFAPIASSKNLLKAGIL